MGLKKGTKELTPEEGERNWTPLVTYVSTSTSPQSVILFDNRLTVCRR